MIKALEAQIARLREQNALLRSQLSDVAVVSYATKIDAMEMRGSRAAEYRTHCERRIAERLGRSILENGALTIIEKKPTDMTPWTTLTGMVAVIRSADHQRIAGLTLGDVRQPSEDDDDFALEYFALDLVKETPRILADLKHYGITTVRFTLWPRRNVGPTDYYANGNAVDLVTRIATVGVKIDPSTRKTFAYVVSR